MRVALLLYCLPAAAFAMCFNETDAKGRRDIIRNATTVIDEYQCKIDCVEMDECLAYFYQAKGTQCVLLGPHEVEPRCLPPAKESLKILDDTLCKDTNSTDVSFFNFKPNPIIPKIFDSPTNEKARPCNSPYAVMDLHLPDGTHHTATCDAYTMTTWDKKLATWKYTYQGVTVDYIRGANCVFPQYKGPLYVNDTSLCNNGMLPPYPGMSPDQAPLFSVINPCPLNKSPLQEINYMLVNGTMSKKGSKNDYVNCVYGSWFLLTYIVDMNSAQEIIAASCTM